MGVHVSSKSRPTGQTLNRPHDSAPNNDNRQTAVSISFADLAAGMQSDKDELLRRFAEVLHKRGMTTDDLLSSNEGLE